jgi:hypothetical protein
MQLLLQLQLVTRDKITEALAYQCRLPPSQFRSLRDILVDMELISEEAMRQAEQSFYTPVDVRDSFQRAMDDILKQADTLQQSAPAVPEPPRTRPVGVRAGVPPAVPEPPRTRPLAQPPPAPPAGQASSHPVQQAEATLVPKTPKAIVPPGSGMQAAGAFARRSPVSQAGGWGATPAPQAQPVIPPAPPVPVPPLGQILMQQKVLEEWQLMHALSLQQSTLPRPRLGTLLVRLGYADQPTVARALSLQVKPGP